MLRLVTLQGFKVKLWTPNICICSSMVMSNTGNEVQYSIQYLSNKTPLSQPLKHFVVTVYMQSSLARIRLDFVIGKRKLGSSR